MKLFIHKIAIFILSICIISGTIAFILHINKNSIISYKLKYDTRLIFIGNSMVECSVNDQYIPNCQNIAKSAKQYLFALIDIREVLAQNPQIDTIILGCSPFTLSEEEADKEYDDVPYLESVNYYAPFLKYNEYAMLPKILPFIKFNIGVYGLRYLSSHQVPGAYLYNQRQNLSKAIEAYNKEKSTENISTNKTNNKITEYSLNEIKKICNDYNVKLMFLSPPIWNAKEIYNLNEYKMLMHKYLTENDNDILDFTQLSLPDSCYADMIHLNHYGADIFTKELKEKLYK